VIKPESVSQKDIMFGSTASGVYLPISPSIPTDQDESEYFCESSTSSSSADESPDVSEDVFEDDFNNETHVNPVVDTFGSISDNEMTSVANIILAPEADASKTDISFNLSSPDEHGDVLERFQFSDVPIERTLLPATRTASAALSDRLSFFKKEKFDLLRPRNGYMDANDPEDAPATKKRALLVAQMLPVFNCFSAIQHSNVASDEYTLPQTFKQAMASHDSSFWKGAIDKEMNSQHANNTWDLVTLPTGKRAIGCRWVFTIKDGSSDLLYKARLVAQGFRQVYGIDYFETSSPVIRYESLRVLLLGFIVIHMITINPNIFKIRYFLLRMAP